MSQELNFSLPVKKEKKGPINATNILLLLLILLSIIIAIMISSGARFSHDSARDLSNEEQKEFALRLQKHNLNREAATAWQNYLNRAKINKKERRK